MTSARCAARAAVAGLLLAATPALAQAPAGELSFTFTDFTDPSCVLYGTPWTPEELTALEAQVAVYYPIAKSVYGNPFDVLTLQVCKMALPGDVSGGYGGDHIVLEGVRPTPFVHEMLHAFHGARHALPIFEEGMVEAATVFTTSIACETVDCSAVPFDAIRTFHSGTTQVYYEALDVPEMSSPGGAYPRNGTWNTHYRVADYAWAKVELEHPGFLRAYNERYFTESAADPTIGQSLMALAAIARELAPTVEGVPFDGWFGAQHVFDVTPPPAPGIAQLRDVRAELTPPDQWVTVFWWDDALQAAEGVPLEWSLLDHGEQPLASGLDVTDANGRIAIRFPDGYVGSARLAVSGGGASSSQFWPVAPSPEGVFGVVPHAAGGSVTVGLDAPGEPTATAPVVVGYFTAPSLGPVAGRLRLVYADEAGGTAEHVFTKDASRYFVLLRLPDLVTDPPTAAPAALLPGDAFPVATAVWNAGDAASPISQVRFFLSADALRDATDVLAGTIPLSALTPGGSGSAATTAVVPADLAPGTYRVIACANDPRVFAETTSSNDCAASAGTVEVGAPYAAQILPPIRADATSAFKASRGALPLKFALALRGAPTCDLPTASLELLRVGDGVTTAAAEELVAMPSDTGTFFRVSECQYVYNLAASALGPGTYRASLRIGGSVVGSATFALR